MHPWKKIIRGCIKVLETKACFICLERIPCSDDDIELKLHLFKVHYVKVHLKELVVMCTEAEEREAREGWSIDDILEDERHRKESDKRKRAESGGWIGILSRLNKRTPECLDNNTEAEINVVDCFLCQEQLIEKSCEYDKHLEKQHGVIFGAKEIKKAGGKVESVPISEEYNNEIDPVEQTVNVTDADTVKELVEMKYLPKKRKIRLRTPRQKLFSRKYQVLIEEVFVSQLIINHSIFCLQDIETDTKIHAAEKVGKRTGPGPATTTDQLLREM